MEMLNLANGERLSARERQVALLAAKGLSNKVIAQELSVTEGTIKLHLHKIYQKLGIQNRLVLALLANNIQVLSR